MNLCSDKHEEVCYEGRHCPVCQKQEEINELEDTVETLQKEVQTLEDAQ
jgi:hypothetical protein